MFKKLWRRFFTGHRCTLDSIEGHWWNLTACCSCGKTVMVSEDGYNWTERRSISSAAIPRRELGDI
jgi:hypothetical protein